MLHKPAVSAGPSQSMTDTISILPGRDLLTLSEVADTLRMSRMTIHRLVRRGRLPAVRITRHFRFHRKDVAALLRDGRAPTIYGTS
ncbi:MAG: helix-turn-helix domain-containing protein [Patescibacteria group bacterium]